MNVETVAQQPPLATAGRGDRVARTREAIVASTLNLAQEGEVSPIVRDIAKAAGVSARTVFQHFADTAELYVAALNRMLTHVGAAPEINPQAPLDQRLGAVISHRSTNFEQLRPMWTFVSNLQRRSSEASDKVLEMYSSNRDQLANGFGPELSAMPAERGKNALNALALVLSPEGWVVLRERLGMTVDQAREEWRFVADSIFSDQADH
ncbi:MAG: TetR/AcrR family transcriptional regulator [Enhydrobacter sp.]|nr:MAG: TetR/AcrR family transcriptional regulator [Enhydrobacter sp.]